MNSIEDNLLKMTIFYSKQSGEIKAHSTGIQDMNYFANDKIDFEIIYDFIVVDTDNFILNNTNLFEVQNGNLVLRSSEIEKYR